jgi:opacity protein-like surface antigen
MPVRLALCVVAAVFAAVAAAAQAAIPMGVYGNAGRFDRLTSGVPSAEGELDEDHERFIDGLVARHRVVLGGDWKPSLAGVEAAYLLCCDSLLYPD